MPDYGATKSDSVQRAVWLGVGLLAVTLTLVALLGGGLFWINHASNHYELPLAIGVTSGFIMLVVALAGLILIYNALGLADGTSALGLPAGSIRALLALALVAVFIGVCSAELFDSTSAESGSSKQILSIAATALTTILGFYFGSNSANDAFNAANQTASSNGSANPPTLDDLSAQGASIKAVADGMQQKFDAVAAPDPDQIAAQCEDGSGIAALREKLAFLSNQVTAAGVDRDRAAKLLATASADASTIPAAAVTMQQYNADATKSQAAFDPALKDYVAARDGLLSEIAKG